MQISNNEKIQHENFIRMKNRYGKKFNNYFLNIFSNLIGCITKV